MIRIDNATYYVSGINYKDSSFWVVDADLGVNNSCPLPRWRPNPLRPTHLFRRQRFHNILVELAPATYNQATFVKCSQEVKDNAMYMPVACLSTSYSFDVITGLGSYFMENLQPCCGYLAMTPLGGQETGGIRNASYAYVKKFMAYGFAVRFPFKRYGSGIFKECLMNSMPASPGDWIQSILMFDVLLLGCAAEAAPLPIGVCLYMIQIVSPFIKLIAGSYWPPWRYSYSLSTSTGKQ